MDEQYVRFTLDGFRNEELIEKVCDVFSKEYPAHEFLVNLAIRQQEDGMHAGLLRIYLTGGKQDVAIGQLRLRVGERIPLTRVMLAIREDVRRSLKKDS